MASPAEEPSSHKDEKFSKKFLVAPKLRGRTVLVTGASRGIGLAIALAFGLQHAKKIFLVGRKEPSLREAAELISKGCGDQQSLHVEVGDVKHREFWVELRKKAVSCTMNGGGCGRSRLISI